MSPMLAHSMKRPVSVKSKRTVDSEQLPLTVTRLVIEAQELPHISFKRNPNALVEVVIGNVRRRTATLKNDVNPRWDTEFVLCAPHHPPYAHELIHHDDRLPEDNSSKLTLNVIHDRIWPEKLLGRVEIDLSELLRLQRLHIEEGECIRVL
jgi:Ca2+-dependent lipid-binding protein